MNITGATVKAIDEKGKVSVVTVEKGGKSIRIKAWASSVVLSKLDVGTVLDASYVVEEKPDQGYGPEIWFKEPPKVGGGGGGRGAVAKSDPVKNAVIAEANLRNNTGMAEASKRKAASELVVAMITYNVAVLQANATAGLMDGKPASKLTVQEVRNLFADCLEIVSEIGPEEAKR